MVSNEMKLFTRGPNEVEVTVSNRTIFRVLGLIFVGLVIVTFVLRASHALTLIFIAFFLAVALNAPVHWIAQHLPGRKRGSRTLATGVSFMIVVLLLGAFLLSLVPPLVKQTGSFIDAAPGLIDDIRNENSSLGSFVRRYNLQDQVDKFSGQVSDWAGGLTGSAFTTVGRVGSNVVSVLTVLVLTFMMLIEGPRWLKFGKRLVPEEREEYAQRLVLDMYKVVKGYVNGQVILAAVAALLISPMLFILDINYPIALVLIVFVCGLIPMVGHSIGAVIVTAVALFTSPWAALIILGYYILYQQIENYFVQPKIQANSTDMSPLLVFASVVIGASLSGLIGALVAIPIAGCLRIIVIDYLQRKKYLTPVEAKATKSEI